MSETLWGILSIEDAQTPVTQVGQAETFEGIQIFVARHNARIAAVTGVFVGQTTTLAETFYETPGGGMMQEADRLTRPGAVKRTGRYNVGFMIRDARDQIAGDDITLAYMTLERLNATISNVFIRHLNWVRHHVLRSLFNNVNLVWWDETLGREITVRRLANTDGTTYAPNLNAEVGTDDNHYLVSGYTAASINNTNNPFPVLRTELDEHQGEGTIVVFINSAQRLLVEALADFTPYNDPALNQPIDVTTIRSAAPSGLPGAVIGRCSRCWVVEWDTVPAEYMVAIDIDQDAPLWKRVDAPTEIPGRGSLALIARQQEFPLEEAFWRDRHGYGVANRTAVAIMQFKASGSYDIPAAYA